MGKRWNKLNKLGKDKKVSEIKLLLVLSSAHHMVTKDITDACQKYKKVMPSTEFINFLNNF
jgi:isocitrate dehydrogenase